MSDHLPRETILAALLWSHKKGTPRIAGVNWEWLLVAKGPRASCRALLPAPGFRGYLRTMFWAQRQVQWSRGWAAALPSLQGHLRAQDFRKGLASSAGELGPVGGGGRNRRGNALQHHSLNFSPTSLSPRGRGGTEVSVHRRKVKGGEREQGAGHNLCPRPLSPGQLSPLSTVSLPCCSSCWGPRVGLPSDLSPREGPWVTAGRSRTSLSGHWRQ